MTHIFHHNDADGWLSAAIVYGYYLDLKETTGNMEEIIFHEVDYSMDLVPKLLEIPNEATIYFVDYSFTKEFLLRLVDLIKVKHFKVTWIDHHKTSAELYVNTPATELAYFDNIVIDEKNEHAACYNTYKFLYPDAKSIPTVVTLVDLWDTWNFNQYEETDKNHWYPIYFNYGCNATMSKIPSNSSWRLMLKEEEHYGTLANTFNVIKCGEIAFNMKVAESEEFISKFGKVVELYGYKTIFANKRMTSLEFGDLINRYDIVSPFYYNAKTGKFIFSLFTNREDIDVSEIAKKFGGGGHKQAAGFQADDIVYECLGN